MREKAYENLIEPYYALRITFHIHQKIIVWMLSNIGIQTKAENKMAS